MTGTSNRIYLNAHENPKPRAEVIQQMAYGMEKYWGSPFSPQCLENELISVLRDSYQTLYRFVKATEEDTFLFMNSGLEALYQVFFSIYWDEVRTRGKKRFVLLEGEDPSFFQAVRSLEPFDCEVKIAPLTSSGTVDLASLERLLDPQTALVSLSWANGLTGVIQPLEEIQELCQKKEVSLHVEGSYALGKLEPSQLMGDYFTFSGAFFHGSKSSGGLFARKGKKLSPFLGRGPDQAFLRGVGLDLASLTTLASACKHAESFLSEMATQVSSLRDFWEEELCRLVPDAFPFFIQSLRLPNVSVIAFPGVPGETLAYFLGKQGIFASFGGMHNPPLPLLLSACGQDPLLSSCALSFSLSPWTHRQELERAVSLLASEVQRLREFSAGVP